MTETVHHVRSRRNCSNDGAERTDDGRASRAAVSGKARSPSMVRRVHGRSTQPCIPSGSLNRVPASAGVRAGMSPLSGGR